MTSLPMISTFALLGQFAQENGTRNGIFRVSICLVKQSNEIRATVPPSPPPHFTTTFSTWSAGLVSRRQTALRVSILLVAR